MKIESKAIGIFLGLMICVAVLISYLDFAGVWITDLLGTYLVVTYDGVTYNFAFLVPIAIGAVLVVAGLYTKTQYADYALLAVGGAIIMMGALSIFPVLIQPHIATSFIFLAAFAFPKRHEEKIKVRVAKKAYV